jgi:Ca-activated chloride channel family protein
LALSTRYGILTPYTSFLADERVSLHANAANAVRARESLDALAEVTGAQGVGQRAAKQSYLNAGQAAGSSFGMANSPAAELSRAAAKATGPDQGRPAQPAAEPRVLFKRRASGMGGMGGMSADAAKPEANTPGQAVLVKDAEGRDGVAETVRRVGAKTFYFKDDGWLDADLGPGDLAQAIAIRQFSDAFFDLARAQSAEQNQYLTFAERVTVKLAGRVYRIDPGTP